MKSWRVAGLDTVVSLLTPDEEEALDLQGEEQYCRDNGLEFRAFPIIDRSVPASDVDAVRLIEQLDADLARGKNILVHCRQGIGRSGLIAAGVLIASGLGPQDAVERVSIARSAPVPETPRQQVWITSDFPSALSAAHSRLGGR